jgi:hypothetical protein
MDHKKCKKKKLQVIKRSPVTQVHQLTGLFMGYAIWQQKEPNACFVSVALDEFRFCHSGKHFYEIKRLADHPR